MNFLILVILLIAATAASLTVAINYLNPSNNIGIYSGHLEADGFQALADAFMKYTSPTTDTITSYQASLLTASPQTSPAALGPPTPSGGTPSPTNDGGIQGNFVAGSTQYLNQVPVAPNNYAWYYGVNAGNYYFCLTPIAKATPTQVAAMYKAYSYARQNFGPNLSMTTSSQCGINGTNGSNGPSTILAVVPRVTYGH